MNGPGHETIREADVWYAPVVPGEAEDSVGEKVAALFDAAGFARIVERDELVGIKMHFGERGNVTHLRPQHVRPLVAKLRDLGTKPFLTDTNVLYKSQRSNAVDHLHLAHAHGFTIENVGAPVFILDGLKGNQEYEIPIDGILFDSVSLAGGLAMMDALIAVTHVTGHIGTGVGATLKNLGMGLSSRMGKLRQHSATKPRINARKCTGCEVCIRWCPEDAISMRGDVAWIDEEKCIGCGECLTVCRFDAVTHDWRVEAAELERRVAEHALGAVVAMRGKIGFFSFAVNVTKDCDCFGQRQRPVIPDIGVLASFDPVAIDTATLDLVVEKTGRELADFAYPHIRGREQLAHGEKIGLGTQRYKLHVLS